MVGVFAWRWANYFTGPGSIARSYRTARTTMMVGKQRMPENAAILSGFDAAGCSHSLVRRLAGHELARPLVKPKAMDNNGLLSDADGVVSP